MPTKVLVPAGVLGLGFDDEALARGIAAAPDIICIDGGSTDSGPFYLGTGTSKYARSVCRDEWRSLMLAREAAQVPLVIGSCGTCGTHETVDWMFDITLELAAELGQSITVTRLYSDMPASDIAKALADGRVNPLVPAPVIDAETIHACDHIVALAGAEHIQAALATGADIVLAGRTTDTATIAALPLLRGEHAGAVWHGAKIGECGAFCTTKPSSGVVMITFDEDGFIVEPMAEDAVCTPHSVSAHMLYENSDPYILYEPGGHLDVTAARYHALDDRQVRVTGSQWVPAEAYDVKLEAARIAGYQTTMLAVIREAQYVSRVREWIDDLTAYLHQRIARNMRLSTDDYTMEFRLIGVDSALGELETRQGMPTEIGVLVIITAADQETATDLARLINPFLLHHPLDSQGDLPTFAFPYSPAHSERGALYEFAMNHVLQLDHPMDGFKLKTDKVGHGKAG